MQISKGKSYRSRAGTIWQIVGQNVDGQFIGVDRNHNVECFFHPDGKRWFRPDRAEDLIEEVK